MFGQLSLLGELLGLLEGQAVRKREARCLGAAQGGHGRPAAQRLADVGAEGADIGALRAGDVDDIAIFLLICFQQLQMMDGDWTLFPLNLDPLPCQVVEPAAVDLDGRVHRRQLHNLPAELLQRRLHLSLARLHRRAGQHPSGGVEGVGGVAQLKGRGVALVLIGQDIAAFGGPAHKDGQHAGGHRIQRAGVADLAGAQQAAQLCHYIKGGKILRFVHDDNSVQVSSSFLVSFLPAPAPPSAAPGGTPPPAAAPRRCSQRLPGALRRLSVRRLRWRR